MRRPVLLLMAFAALTACAVPTADPLATARHVPSNEPYGSGDARMHLFLFDPDRPRSLADRKAIARRTIALEPRCVWVDAPDAVLIEATARQGARYTESLLVAPLRCSNV